MKTWIWIIIGVFVALSIGMFIIGSGEDSNKFPKSEYTRCIEASQDRSCEVAILERQGITDGIDCIMDYDKYSLCDDIDRYNAEVDASSDCFGKKPNLIDCIELIQ